MLYLPKLHENMDVRSILFVETLSYESLHSKELIHSFLILTVTCCVCQHFHTSVSLSLREFLFGSLTALCGRLGKTGRQVKIDKKDMTDRDVSSRDVPRSEET